MVHDELPDPMRLSTYTRVLPIVWPDDATDDAHALLVNGPYGAMDVVDASTASSLVAGRSCRDRALEACLLRRGHLTTSSPEEEERTLCFLSRFCRLSLRKSVSFEIVPTYDCNFRCLYCFESHRLGKGAEWLSKRMSPEMLDAFFAAIKRRQSRGVSVDVVILFGGEPLLAENRDLIRAICERCRKLRVPSRSSRMATIWTTTSTWRWSTGGATSR